MPAPTHSVTSPAALWTGHAAAAAAARNGAAAQAAGACAGSASGDPAGAAASGAADSEGRPGRLNDPAGSHRRTGDPGPAAAAPPEAGGNPERDLGAPTPTGISGTGAIPRYRVRRGRTGLHGFAQRLGHQLLDRVGEPVGRRLRSGCGPFDVARALLAPDPGRGRRRRASPLHDPVQPRELIDPGAPTTNAPAPAAGAFSFAAGASGRFGRFAASLKRSPP